MGKLVKVEALIKADVALVWEKYTNPKHVTGWNFASPDWHCPGGSADLREGGSYSYTMAARDGSMSFDFGGIYTLVEPQKQLRSTLEDNRVVDVLFKETSDGTQVSVSFELEATNSEELQLEGWGAILNEFKRYCEA